MFDVGVKGDVNCTPRPILGFSTEIFCWVWFENIPNF
jgi:hypothetical protein